MQLRQICLIYPVLLWKIESSTFNHINFAIKFSSVFNQLKALELVPCAKVAQLNHLNIFVAIFRRQLLIRLRISCVLVCKR